MTIDLANYEQKAREAVKIFWESREQARQKQIGAGKADQAQRTIFGPPIERELLVNSHGLLPDG